ncbi:hypothetical protein GQ44DRAFT_618987 [Phaeosphaeriaceae sp. PMI808]|nr:hypothetical protein GQ44DRAFT_618987 [Phaeosphaeriaceae sp. PMI808]
MTDQILPAPQAPQPTITSAPVHTTAAPQSNLSQPTTANPAPPSTTPDPAVPSTTTPPTDEAQTLNARLNNVDRYWKFKGALQTVTIILGLIGIGTLAWSFTKAPDSRFSYDYSYGYLLWPCLLSFSISILWCSVCILVLVLRKRPVHPGTRVAIELILWLGFITTALFGMLALAELISWGEFGDLGYGYSSSGGRYRFADNGTWVWSDRSSSSGSGRDCNRSSSSSSYGGDYGSMFRNCQEQDAYINKLWQEKPHLQAVETTGVVCQFFVLVLHFALFVWACVDCHHYNRSKVSKDAEKLAANIVQTMISNGAIVPPPGQAHVRPPVMPWGQPQMGYYQLPMQQQAYPMTAMYPQRMVPGQAFAPPQQPVSQQGMQGPVGSPSASSSNEKSEGPRYA